MDRQSPFFPVDAFVAPQAMEGERFQPNRVIPGKATLGSMRRAKS